MLGFMIISVCYSRYSQSSSEMGADRQHSSHRQAQEEEVDEEQGQEEHMDEGDVAESKRQGKSRESLSISSPTPPISRMSKQSTSFTVSSICRPANLHAFCVPCMQFEVKVHGTKNYLKIRKE